MLLRGLEAAGYRVLQEPLEEWGSLLDDFYADLARDAKPAPSALPFSLKVLEGFAGNGGGGGDDIWVYERSPATCKEVFTKMLLDDKRITADEWGVFCKYYDVLAWEPDLVLYVNTPVETCLERVQQRGRACEEDISYVYLRRLEFAYRFRLTHVPCLMLDGLLPPDQLAIKAAELIASFSKQASI